jgi:NAD(P)-dependent dehydrogenase (short-subunit alcohol dehydrogenase family)
MTTNSFAGKTALVIGGTSGMGKATAKLLLSLGAKLIVASKSGKSVDAAVAELGKHGEVTGKVLDLTDDADVKRFVQEISEFDLPARGADHHGTKSQKWTSGPCE